jgi:hypothetical protein
MNLAFWRKKSVEEKTEFITDEKNIIGVTMSWTGRPCLSFKGGYILPYNVERSQFPQYFKNGDWPTHPDTGEKLPIAK